MNSPDFSNRFKELREASKQPAIDAGWIEIVATSGVWDEFYEVYNFRPSIYPEDWPGITEPVPSVTFKIDHFFPVHERKADGYLSKEVAALGEFYKNCFRNVLKKNEKVVTLDWQHPCYRFDPWSEFDVWPILPIPDGDYYIFLTPDLKGGFFGHPWEGTICVMGEKFVSQLGNAPKDFLKIPIRRDGIPV